MKDTSIEDCLNDAPQETVPNATTSNQHNNHTDNNKGNNENLLQLFIGSESEI